MEDLKKIKDSLNFLTEILDNIPIGVVIIDQNRKIININKEALHITRYNSRNDLIGTFCNDTICIHEEKCPIIDGKKDIDKKECVILDINKQEIPILKSVIPISFNNQDMLLETITDISDLKKTQKKLQKSEETFRYVLEHSPTMIYKYDFLKDKIDYVSASSTEILGYNPGEFKKLGIKNATNLVHPDDRKLLIQNFKKIIKLKIVNEIKTTIQYRFKNKKIGYIWIEDSRLFMFGNDYKPISMIGNVVDISAKMNIKTYEKEFRNELEKKVNQKTKDLEDSALQQKTYLDQIVLMSEYKDNFYSSISHEFKTPLNVILGFTDVLLDGFEGDLNEGQHQLVNDIKKESKKLSDIIHDTIEFSEIYSRSYKLNIEEKEISEIIEIFKNIFQEKKKGKEIILKIDSCKNMLIKLDSNKIKMVFEILLGYSLNKMVSGTINFKLTKIRNFLQFFISSTANSEVFESIEPLLKEFDIEKSIMINNQNTSGLKIPIAKRIIELIGGKFTIVNKDSKNLSFIIQFLYQN